MTSPDSPSHREEGASALVTRPTAATAVLVALGAAGVTVALALSVQTPLWDLLVALSGTLLVAGALNHLIPTRNDHPPAVVESTFAAATAAIESAALGGATPAYVPVGGEIRLRVPADGDREDGLRPTGAGLYRTVAADLPADGPPEEVLAWLAEALEGRFGLVSGPTVSIEGTEATVALEGWTPAGIDRIDHPAISVLAVGLADRLDRPVRATVTERSADSATIRLRWEVASDDPELADQFANDREREQREPGDDREPEPVPPGRDGDA